MRKQNYGPGLIIAILFSAVAALATGMSTLTFTSFGTLTCGAGNAGIVKPTSNGEVLQFCDNAATPALRHLAVGDSNGDALGGDSATGFFLAGQIEPARGGTGIDTSASTGTLRVASGTWSANTETGTGNSVRATAPTIDSPVFTTKYNPPSVTAFPGSPSTGDTVIVTDDSAVGACDSAAGSAITHCRWDGAAWTALGDGGAGGGGYDTIENETTPLTQRTTLNFAGAGVSCADDTTKTTCTISGSASPLTTKGDLFTFDTGDARLPVGTNGQVLTADSAEATGLKWAASSGSGSMQRLIWTANQAVQSGTGTLATQDTRNGHPVLDFDAAADECSYWHGFLPSTYAGGGLDVTLVWLATSATTGATGWLTAIERHEDDAFDLDADGFAADNSASATTASVSGEAQYTTIAHTTGAQMDSLVAGESFRLRVCRDGDGSVVTDDMTGDAELYRVVVKETGT